MALRCAKTRSKFWQYWKICVRADNGLKELKVLRKDEYKTGGPGG